MIIIEGADNVGKTTLVKQLLELDPQLRVVHRKRFRPGQEETIATSYLEALLSPDGDRVAHGYSLADRMMASECIYGELFRGGCRMTEAEHWAIRAVLNSYNAFVVWCDIPDGKIKETWKDREQMWGHALEIAGAYREEVRSIFRSQVVWRYDWSEDDAETMRHAIISEHVNRMADNHEALSWWAANPWGVGNIRNPRVILIGEAPSPKATTPVPFAHGPAGDFLVWTMRQVWESGGPMESQYYVTNARKGTGRDEALLREELGLLVSPHTVVVTLGREAEKMFDYIRPTLLQPVRRYSNLPHPQYWRRFKYPEKEEYVTMFRHAVEG